MSSVELARVAGPVAAAGLALLLVSGRRDLRLAGLAPLGDRRARVRAAAGAVGAPPAARGGRRLRARRRLRIAWLLARWPWLLALGALAAVPARVPVHVGSTEANLLIPMYGIVAARPSCSPGSSGTATSASASSARSRSRSR